MEAKVEGITKEKKSVESNRKEDGMNLIFNHSRSIDIHIWTIEDLQAQGLDIDCNGRKR